MRNRGYRIIPVNPAAREILGLPCYPSLGAMPAEVARAVDMVNVFRPSADLPAVVTDAIMLQARAGRPLVLWTQLGISHEAALAQARQAGLNVVADRCLKIEHERHCA
jgi:hypothetical protein